MARARGCCTASPGAGSSASRSPATGLLLFPLALVQQLEIVTAITLLLGFTAGVAWITGNTLLGLEVPDEVRGRTFAFVGSMIRLSLALVLAVAPLVAGTIGHASRSRTPTATRCWSTTVPRSRS